MAVVQLDHVHKRFGDVVAVEDFSLTTDDGEFVVLVGPSGCGKTTAMRMIAGLEVVTEGTVRFDGQDVSNQLPHDRDVAMVFQNYALFPHLDVYGNIAFGMRLRKTPKEEVDRRVKQVAHTLGIESVLNRRPRELSGGQRQRVALGRAIVREPRVFLMDEPLSNLDAALRMEMRAEIIKLQRRLEVTTFYVTHDQVEALSMGDRIVVMRNGRIQQIGTPIELYEQPSNAYVASFIGSPPMNFLNATLEGSEVVLADEHSRLRPTGPAQAAVQGTASREVIVGVRPEHLTISNGGVATGGGTLRGTVDTIEPLGHTTLVRINLPSGKAINALMTGKVRLRSGEPVQAEFPADRAYLFDRGSDQTLAGIST